MSVNDNRARFEARRSRGVRLVLGSAAVVFAGLAIVGALTVIYAVAGFAVVAAEARLVARAVCCVITVVDPELIVLGGGIGQAPGFASAVAMALSGMTPVLPEVKVSALGSDVVVDGCLAEGASLAWNQLTSRPLGHAAQ